MIGIELLCCVFWYQPYMIFYVFKYYLFVFVFLGPYLWHMEGPRLGVESKLQLLAYASAAAMLDLSHICDLHHSLWQHRILNPLGKARDQTHILMDTSQVLNPLSHNGNSCLQTFLSIFLNTLYWKWFDFQIVIIFFYYRYILFILFYFIFWPVACVSS